MAQATTCNRVHLVEQRCARWLLQTHDRVGSDQFLLTQEFLAQMLGVRRAGVSAAAGLLQKAGLIRYARGRITVLTVPGLESAACECYRVIKREFDRLDPLTFPKPASAIPSTASFRFNATERSGRGRSGNRRA